MLLALAPSTVLRSHSKLSHHLAAINEDGTYVSADDADYGESLGDAVSKISLDKYTYETVTTAYKPANRHGGYKALLQDGKI